MKSLCLALAIVGFGAIAAAPAQDHPRYIVKADHDPDGIGVFYMGREIAQVMGH